MAKLLFKKKRVSNTVTNRKHVYLSYDCLEGSHPGWQVALLDLVNQELEIISCRGFALSGISPQLHSHNSVSGTSAPAHEKKNLPNILRL